MTLCLQIYCIKSYGPSERKHFLCFSYKTQKSKVSKKNIYCFYEMQTTFGFISLEFCNTKHPLSFLFCSNLFLALSMHFEHSGSAVDLQEVTAPLCQAACLWTVRGRVRPVNSTNRGPLSCLIFFQKHCYVEYRSIVMLGKVFPESIDRSFGRSIVCGEGAMSPE